MFIAKLQALRERGDTIVEVLIAVTVVSMVLGGAYTATNRSMQTARTTEERGIALKLAESQIEQTKGIITRDPSKIFDSAYSNFCIYANEVYADTDSKCRVDNKGKSPATGLQYAVRISRSGDTFTTNVQWQKIGGGQNSVRMIYRVHE